MDERFDVPDDPDAVGRDTDPVPEGDEPGETGRGDDEEMMRFPGAEGAEVVGDAGRIPDVPVASRDRPEGLEDPF